MKRIYLDHAATTALDNEIFEQIKPYFCEIFGNASSQHTFGQTAEKAVIGARERIARTFNASPGEIYFTSGGAESDNWAIKGAAAAHKSKGRHIITSAIEHPAVINTLKHLERDGFEVTYLPVDAEGFVTADAVEKAIRKDTILITIMLANNEIGTIEPIAEISKIAKKHGVIMHTDAVQAAGALHIDVKKLGVDMLSISGHKFYGPKGVGALYKRNGLKIERFIDGGEQERALRAGTTNTPAIIGMSLALEKAEAMIDYESVRLSKLRNGFVRDVLNKISNIKYNGPALGNPYRLPANASFSFDFIEGESILMRLDFEGIAVSSGSACSAGSLDPSHVIIAIDVPLELAQGTVRFSFGRENTEEDAKYTVQKLIKVVADLRQLSPIKE